MKARLKNGTSADLDLSGISEEEIELGWKWGIPEEIKSWKVLGENGGSNLIAIQFSPRASLRNFNFWGGNRIFLESFQP